MDRNLLIRRMTHPFSMMSRIFEDFEKDYQRAMQPEDGHYVTYELNPIHWQIETNEAGDVIHRRLTADEAEAMKTHDEDGNQ